MQPSSLSGTLAGIHTSVGCWLKEREAFFGSDAATDVQPSMVEGIALPVHTLLSRGPHHDTLSVVRGRDRPII